MTSSRTIRLGTRASALALWQAEWTKSRLEESGRKVELIKITTQGDTEQRPLTVVGGQGLFTKKLQESLLANEIDLAVHSLKDLPTDRIEGLTLAGVPVRESCHDVLITPNSRTLKELPFGSRVGTGSLRRQAQLLHLRPDLKLEQIRGNVDTRLRKLDTGEFDAIMLAEAGLNRLGLTNRISERMSYEAMLPAVGQGALGWETRADDTDLRSVLESISHSETWRAVEAERNLLRSLRAGCLAPVAAHARVNQSILTLTAAVLSVDGTKKISVVETGELSAAEEIGKRAAETLLKYGAGELIQVARAS